MLRECESAMIKYNEEMEGQVDGYIEVTLTSGEVRYSPGPGMVNFSGSSFELVPDFPRMSLLGLIISVKAIS